MKKINFICENGGFMQCALICYEKVNHFIWTNKNEQNVIRMVKIPNELGCPIRCYESYGDIHLILSHQEWYISLSDRENYNTINFKLSHSTRSVELNVYLYSFTEKTKIPSLFSFLFAICKRFIKDKSWNDISCENRKKNTTLYFDMFDDSMQFKSGNFFYVVPNTKHSDLKILPINLELPPNYQSHYETESEVSYDDFVSFFNFIIKNSH